jgi:hypothetical protein
MAPSAQSKDQRRNLRVRVRMTIPRRHRGERVPIHPSTISPLTQSVSIAVNGGAGQIFNATPSSPGCSAGAYGTTCTFAVAAPPGSDTFVVTTYSSIAGGGFALDHGSAVVVIKAGQANSPLITLGPVVTTTLDNGMGSLRYAIDTANPGDTITFMLPATAVIAVGKPLTLPGSLTIAGPGVTTSIHRTGKRLHPGVTFSGITIDGLSSQQIFVVNAGVTATISGLILAHGMATVANRPGGAVYNAGSLTLANDGFSQNNSVVFSPYGRKRLGRHPSCTHTYYYGGAVYNHGDLTVTNSTFDGNQLQNNLPACQGSNGGALYNDQYGTVTVTGSMFSNNSANVGGAVFNNSTFGQATFSNDTFTGNTTCTPATGCTIPSGNGAAIEDGAAAGPGIVVTNSTFSDNVAGGIAANSSGMGGALNLETGSPVITGSTFTGNIAGGGSGNCSSGSGGAIHSLSASSIEIDNDTFINNQALSDYSSHGGAVDDDDSIVRGSGDTFTSNAATATGSACATSGFATGGAIAAPAGLNLSASTFNDNAVSANFNATGGAVYEGAPSTLSGDTFAGNSATGTGANGAASVLASGGAVSAAGLALYNNTFTSNSITIGTANAMQAFGGAVTTATLVSIGNTFTSNSATATGAGTPNVEGGGLFVGTHVSSMRDTFKANAATGPGAVLGGGLTIVGTFTLSNSTITGNTGTVTVAGGYAEGGGVYLGGAGALAGGTIAGNAAGNGAQEGLGGGIYDYGGATISGATIAKNTATFDGGGIHSVGSETLSGSTVSGNQVTAASGNLTGGGGIYNANSTAVTNSTINGNSVVVTPAALNSGGGGILGASALTLSGSTVSGNVVTGGVAGVGDGGGGILSNDNLTVVNSTVTGNSSSVDGGGFETLGSLTQIFSNDTFYQNKATGKGGNIYNPYTIYLTNSIVAGGSAAQYTDIDNAGTLNSGDYNIIEDGMMGNAPMGATTHNVAVDPKLLPLSNNGGPTFTNADQPTSPGRAAIPFNAGSCGGVMVAVDQRNFSRGAGSVCDIGAYEYAGVASAIRMHVTPARPSKRKHKP